MKKNTRKNSKEATGPCVCQLVGTALSDLLHSFEPPAQARRHFQTARLEVLKGMRAILDARIEHVANTKSKGQKIDVE